ncbi:type VI secretion system baseplate subunit TssK [uncultured Thiodictyon sp.]|uniref:type VI secretion system baseplate subunit TssK n=1 Tax=uncultured Thiodictyon sp. TaxID=1846217 RepID=UPI0025DB5E8B|nr:type VI secretion system baseplate subunit TssK [uncultured Thiodictyon sp.]
MAQDNRVLWSEGLFLQPHHFQQHDRYLEHLVESQAGLGCPYPWGLTRLAIDRDLLAQGRLAVTDCAGRLPDGTPFDAPASDPLPPPLLLEADAAGQIIYLALPLRRPGAAQSGAASAPETMLRYRAGELRVLDDALGADTETLLEVGRLDLRLLRENDARDGFACCGLARVLGRRADLLVQLDDTYCPPCLELCAAPRLTGFLEEVTGLMHRQAEARAGRVRGGGRGAVSDWADFLMLQLINRSEPLAIHLGRIQGLHPEPLYRFLLGLAGELATYAADNKRPPDFPPYRHDDLDASFTPLMARLRDYLSRELVERAIQIQIQERKFGFRVALVPDRNLLAEARFVLAVHADMDSQALRNRFPPTAKIASVEKIQEFVRLALPGVPLRAMPTAPLEIPYHAGSDYFELDRTSEYWTQVVTAGTLGLHIGGEFPGLELALWAIRE